MLVCPPPPLHPHPQTTAAHQQQQKSNNQKNQNRKKVLPIEYSFYIGSSNWCKRGRIFLMITLNNYTIPVPKSLLQRIDRTSSPVHFGSLRNAVDLIVPQSTPVFAAADGVVTFVHDNCNIGGPSPPYWNCTNFIAIMHSNGEYSRYDHLEYGSAKVMVGQQVHAGQEIAKVGMTGYTYIPHLHFHLFVFTGYNIWADFDTLEVNILFESVKALLPLSSLPSYFYLLLFLFVL
jgi:murein DD-endopeptidase MepM/ murein hydrolase activator NlpD